MDLKKFNDEFPSYAKMAKQQEIENYAMEEIRRQQMFKAQFPEVNYNNIQKQCDTVITLNLCTYYKDTQTNKVYSWNQLENRWNNEIKDLSEKDEAIYTCFTR